MKQLRFGDYYLTPFLDEWKGTTSWWISKEGNTDAYYCFTADSQKELEYQTREETIGGYRAYYDLRHKSCPEPGDLNLIDTIFRAIDNSKHPDRIWYEGDDILVKTEEMAGAIADFLDCLGYDAVTGYFDPEEDAREGINDELTGWYYVTV